MPGLFSRFKGKDSKGKKSKNGNFDQLADQLAKRPKWVDAFTRITVEPYEVQELIRCCTEELKARALDHPFLLLPFRPTSDPSAVRNFIRHFFDQNMTGDIVAQELRMTEAMVVSGVIKWCWSRLPGGIVGWDAYELFKVGETDSNMARDSFKTFIPLSVDYDGDRSSSVARACIIFDFFDLLAAIAAHAKMNGFGGRKLSRMASWWAFEQKYTSEGFEGGYKAWLRAADATSHLFFAYLRSVSPESPMSGISMIPMSLQKLLQETEYPPERPALMQVSTYKVVMIVDTVSPTPFALLRRANHFNYRSEDRPLYDFSEYEDPVKALTEECKRVLRAISSANQSQVSSSKHSTSLRDASWSRFEDIGFASALEEEDEEDSFLPQKHPHGLRKTPASGGDGLARPTTPSWADFLSFGFVENRPSNLILSPDKVLPPIETAVRQRSSQSHGPRLEMERNLEPGELASISRFDLDEAFWWVWMSSLAPEETPDRKSAFGRCAVIETGIRNGRWLVMEEMVKGAAPEPDPGAYIAEKKSFFSWTKKSKGIGRRKSTGKGALGKNDSLKPIPGSLSMSKTSIAPEQQARIQAAAQELQARSTRDNSSQRQGRRDVEPVSQKTTSVFTLQPVILNEASSAMKWATQYDKQAVREAYLTAAKGGRSIPTDLLSAANGTDSGPAVPEKSASLQPRPSPGLPVAMNSPATLGDKSAIHLSEKDIEALKDVHPAERIVQSPVPSRKDESEVLRQNMISPDPAGFIHDSKKRGKLHKEKEKDKMGGFKKLFARKNRSSKLPENAERHLHNMIKTPEPEPKTAIRVQKRPEATQMAAAAPIPLVAPNEPEPRPGPAPGQASSAKHSPGSRKEGSTHEAASDLTPEDAREAHQEFSQFDQGPLVDQPAWVAESNDESEDATPPPIQRHSHKSPAPMIPPSPSPEEAKPVPAQDHWAQIRKNAERAAHQR